MSLLAVKARMFAAKAVAGLMRKDKGGKEIIVEIGIAVIAVALLLIFRDKIKEVVTAVLDAAKLKIDAMMTI